jgi:PAS domain S-box-containing protein
MLGRLLKVISNPYFWLVLVMFVAGVILHYPQRILGVDSTSLLSFLGLERHAMERVFLLVPVTCAGFVFGTGGGLVSLAVALVIMLPRAIFLSVYPADALFETGAVVVTGGLVNLWFHIHRGDIIRRRRAEEMLTKIVDGSSVPSFVINKQHVVTHWNTAIESLSGLKREDIIGTDEQWRAFYNEKRPAMADLIVDEASEEEIASYYLDKYEKSGLVEGAYEAEDFFSEIGGGGRWLHFTASPIRDSRGEIIGAKETLVDVTDRRKAENNLRYYLQQVTRAQEEERRRIARELHDETAQDLVILLRQINTLASKGVELPEELQQQTHKILDGVRRFSHDLRPPILDDLGLMPALEWLTSDLNNSFDIDIDMEVLGTARRFSPEIELVLFRIAQEALRNVWKHSKASEARVTVEFGDDKTVLTVKDNGQGFELPGEIGDLTVAGKLGLVGMQERAQLIGGTLTLQSELGKGTTVTVEVPFSVT